jgi:hypothetical protein
VWATFQNVFITKDVVFSETMLSLPQIQYHKTLENMTMIPLGHIIISFIVCNGDAKPCHNNDNIY